MFNTIKNAVKRALVVIRRSVMWVLGKEIIKSSTIMVAGIGGGYFAGAVLKGISFGPKANIGVKVSTWLAGAVLAWSFVEFVEKTTASAFDTHLESLVGGLTFVIDLL